MFDFSDTGNACYILNKIPYDQRLLDIHIQTLKPWGQSLTLIHRPGWQRRFDEKLAELGIFSSQANNSISGYRKRY